MKKILLWIVFLTVVGAQAASSDLATLAAPPLQPLPEQSKAARLSAELLTRYHYRAVPLDDALSEKIAERYLKLLDSEKLFFVQGDIDQLKVARTKFDDAIYAENLGLPFAVFNLYTRRVFERFTYARSLLAGGFDFSEKERYDYGREKAAWAKSGKEINELWRARVKNDWLRLKLAGRDDKSIVETLDKRYENSLQRVGRTKSEDAFQLFMNAYATAIEPHTDYMGPRAAEEFEIAMRLSLVGIGAVLTQKDDYTVIRELVPGGPAQLSEQLKPGDRIVGVAQGKKGAMTDIVGWRMDDAVALIRGESDSVVVLDILPVDGGPDGKHKVVSITRKKITLEQQAAKKSVISVADGKTTQRIGVISLPTFYADFEARGRGAADYKSATRDVARLLDELKADKVDGVLVDLRNNGGGSLAEAVELSGLFIGAGPVVQQRDAKGGVTVARAADAVLAWNGPLAVLINRRSASASEIFAAAIQDYGRGLVIGERSFGKGTVQTMVNLNRFVKDKTPELGELKMTIAQFFRVTGGTTQLRGVEPDISLPSFADEDNSGESSLENALPWVKIPATDYARQGNPKALVPALKMRHEARVKFMQDYQFLKEDVAELGRLRKRNSISLNEAERRQERDTQEARIALREKLRGDGKSAGSDARGEAGNAGNRSSSRDDGLQADERDLGNELAAEKARKNAKDILLEEAARILGDEVGLLPRENRVAARHKADSSIIPGQNRQSERAPATIR
ncbi:carboxy terminal-processing peptidase [Candidatus Accumulibacter sp. ACC003]|jgi:carboxyl-terminal processing protease|uniref:carboxy terminal-processing peptidase n=1 Tax=Candidatus Accumulibacter sp. ACC003 TaxID=2823334 RepID=UPI0025C5BBF7|nr:carboxy terminal-processing peptidase [Candidatus Accumulibacter sp. ACC003]